MSYCKKVKIIIVDNCKAFCDILNAYLLEQKDIVVTGIANDGIQALKLIQEKKPDLVLLNIIMPNLDGLGVLERLQTVEIDPKPRIIVLSAISETTIIKKALKLGADRYIVKPFEFDSLIVKPFEFDSLIKLIRKMFTSTLHSFMLFIIIISCALYTYVSRFIDCVGNL